MSFSSLGRLIVVSGCLTIFGACGTEEGARPPGLDSDGGGVTGPIGDGDGPSMGGANDGDTISGSLVQFDDASFDTTTSYPQSAQLFVLSEDSSSFIEGEATSDGAFELAGLEAGSSRWIGVDPETDASMMTTFNFVKLEEEPVELAVAPVALFEGMVSSLQASPTLNGTAAQLALRIVDNAGDPIPGVEVSFNSGGGTVAYRAGDAWLEEAAGTDESGQIYIANVAGASLPGTTVQIIFTGSVDAETSMRAINGAAVVRTVVAGP